MLQLSLSQGKVCPAYSQNKEGTARRSLIFNECDKLPTRFRSCLDSPHQHSPVYQEPVDESTPKLNLTGYQDTKMSGSSQFCLGQIDWMRERWKGDDVMVVELRMEAHGFIDDQAIGFFCPKNWDLYHSDTSGLKEREEKDLKGLSAVGKANIFTKISGTEVIVDEQEVKFSTTVTEEQALRDRNIKYARLYVPDHRRPRDSEVQQFLDLHDPTIWFHFHCKGGRGRTTTAMIMRDMLINPHVPSADIIERNNVYGSIDITNLDRLRGTFKEGPAKERLEFILMFHTFAKLFSIDSRLSWTRFLSLQSRRPFSQKSLIFGFSPVEAKSSLVEVEIDD